MGKIVRKRLSEIRFSKGLTGWRFVQELTDDIVKARPNGACLRQSVGWVSVFCVTHQALFSSTTLFQWVSSGISDGLRHKLRA